MRAYGTPEDDIRRRQRASVLVSLAVHGLLLLALPPRPEPPPDDPVMEVSLVQMGVRDVPSAAAPQTPPPPVPEQKPRPVAAPKVAPLGTHAPSPVPQPPAPAPVAQPQPAQPMSFREWQRNRPSMMPSRSAVADLGGSRDGRDAAHRNGVNRCDPPTRRPAEVVYLLFDTSGSMSDMMRSQALACAHQYAQAAIESGGHVVVGNFAMGTTLSAPTRDMLDVEIALRGASDARATILPTRELDPLLAKAPDAISDLVIISDGWFLANREVLIWYRYFLELNPENRGAMFTVGSPGHRDGVAALRGLGFDVFEYEQIRRSP